MGRLWGARPEGTKAGKRGTKRGRKKGERRARGGREEGEKRARGCEWACTPVIVLGTSCERTIIRSRLISQKRRVTSGPKVTHPAPRAAELPKPSAVCGSAHIVSKNSTSLGSLVETGTGRRRSMAFICSMVAVPVRHRPPWRTKTSLLTRAASGRSENTS